MGMMLALGMARGGCPGVASQPLKATCAGVALAVMASMMPTCGAAGPPVDPTEQKGVTQLTLQELMDLTVITSSRRPTRQIDTPSAVFVMNREDIRRTGARTLPDLLRYVPGVQVANVNGGVHAVAIRGLNKEYSNKLLVLIDGRAIYTQIFSGVAWMEQQIMIEDIERIEVIRGPGASVWGANAVNGVINIITRSAQSTQGGLISVGGGTMPRAFGSARYGGKLGKSGYYRIWGGGYDWEHFDPASDTQFLAPTDDWIGSYAGLRMDLTPTEQDTFTLSARFFEQQLWRQTPRFSPSAPYVTPESATWRNSGGHIMASWQRQISARTEFALTTFAEDIQRENPYAPHDQGVFDIDATMHTGWAKRHELVAGVGYRLYEMEGESDFTYRLDKLENTDQLFSAFAQYDLALVLDLLHLITGAKAEKFESIGWEVQPTAKLLVTPSSHQTLWASVSRAVRTPSDYDQFGARVYSVTPPGTEDPELPTFEVRSNSGTVAAEELIAYEAGYRIVPVQNAWIDLALFYNDYDDLKSTVAGGSSIKGGDAPYIEELRLVSPTHFGKSYGTELTASWQVAKDWRLQAAYSYLQMAIDGVPGSRKEGLDTRNERAPHNQAYVRSMWNVTSSIDLDAAVRYVDELPDLDVPGYVTCDLRAAWRARPDFELSIVGRDLSEPHVEWANVKISPSVYVRAEWLF